MNENSLDPKTLRAAINQYFEQTPAAEVVRRAEELTPPPGSEPLGMLPEGAETPSAAMVARAKHLLREV